MFFHVIKSSSTCSSCYKYLFEQSIIAYFSVSVIARHIFILVVVFTNTDNVIANVFRFT